MINVNVEYIYLQYGFIHNCDKLIKVTHVNPCHDVTHNNINTMYH